MAGRECRDDRLTRPMGSTVVTFLTHYPHSLEDSWSIPRAARGERHQVTDVVAPGDTVWNSCEPFSEISPGVYAPKFWRWEGSALDRHLYSAAQM